MSDGRDYAAEAVARGQSEPENPPLYNVIRASLDYWWDFTTAEAMLRDKGPEAYRDGLARRLLCDLRIARQREEPTMVTDTENTLIFDRNKWLWQRRIDKWVCVTQEVGGPPTRTFDELVRDYGPLTEVQVVNVA